MATINPIGYPLKVSIPSGLYTISNSSNEIVYTGTAYPFPNETSITIDMSDILRGYVSAPSYDDLLPNSSSANSINISGFVHSFTLNAGGTTSQRNFIWNYTGKSGDYLKNGTSLNKYPDNRIFNKMWLPINSIATDAATIAVNRRLGTSTSRAMTFNGVGSGTALTERFNMYNVSLTDNNKYYYSIVNATTNNTLTVSELESQGPCVPDNTYTLYYVNMNGALDFVHCTGTFVEKTNVTKNSYTRTAHIDTPKKHSIVDYNIQTYKSYTFNTGLMNDYQSYALQDLFKSPYVWMYDYKTEQFTAIEITDKTVEIKRRSVNHMFNYTISAKDSQTYTIHA